MRVEKDTEIAFLREQLARSQVMQRDADESSTSISTTSSSGVPPSSHSNTGPARPQLVPWMHSISERGDIQTSRLGRHASLKSVRVLADLQTQQQQTHDARAGVALAERVAAAFLNPVLSLPYLHSIQFGADLVELSAHVGALLESESRCLSLASPVYVFGDLHGNWNDLSFFAQHFWRFGFGLSAGTFLFLGDYVDRGASSLECVAYLFAHKLLHPHKVFLLRGNHETRAVNGLEHYYGSGCFLSQCRARFGRDEGAVVWHQINHAFDRLPLAATIDDRVFCVHGGIPRGLVGSESRLTSIRRLPATAPMDALDKKVYDANPHLRMVSDLLWGDPAREEHESALDPVSGFGPSVLRGGSAVSFGDRAIAAFLETHGMTHILRAHEAHVDGVAVAKSARVVTIFSTSKDHALGEDATCGCVLVDKDRIAAINRSAATWPLTLRRRRSVTSLLPPGPFTPRTVARGASASAASAPREEAEEARRPAAAASSFSASNATATTARRRAPHRDACASTTLAPPLSSAVLATAHDESDSTDDEAPTARAIGPRSSSASSRGRGLPGDDSNQSED
jgi:diadenosine tetraphosphatase ApaH/serine/threonine PP2A family protein phosphatase